MQQNPFSVYDFLGYLIPGAVLTYILIFLCRHLTGWEVVPEVILEEGGLGKIDFYIPMTIFSYIMGHFLSFLSSLTVERYSIWIHGYPSRYLLGHNRKDIFFGDISIFHAFLRLIAIIFLAPISFWEFIIGDVFRSRKLYTKPLDKLLAQIIIKKSRHLIHDKALGGKDDENVDGREDDVDFFRFIYHYVIEKSTFHNSKLSNYVALYGFLKSLSLISVFVFWVILIHIFYMGGCFLSVVSYLAIFSMVCYLIFLSFVKFYRRFSLEVMMAVSVIYEDDVMDGDTN